MNTYIDGNLIKELREKKKLTQKELANTLMVSDKTISKWETGRGLPDITIVDALAKALGISIIELFNASCNINNNKPGNMLKQKYYVCPICNNVIRAVGDATISCCGINLPVLEAEETSNETINILPIENELYIQINHEMNKTNYILFIAYVTSDKEQFVRLYPEQLAEARFIKNGHGYIYYYCIKEGLSKIKI